MEFPRKITGTVNKFTWMLRVSVRFLKGFLKGFYQDFYKDSKGIQNYSKGIQHDSKGFLQGF